MAWPRPRIAFVAPPFFFFLCFDFVLLCSGLPVVLTSSCLLLNENDTPLGVFEGKKFS